MTHPLFKTKRVSLQEEMFPKRGDILSGNCLRGIYLGQCFLGRNFSREREFSYDLVVGWLCGDYYDGCEGKA